MIVQKYGGSSLATADKIIKVAKNIIERKKIVKDIIVVVSAIGDSTDELLGLAQKVSSNPLERELDVLLSTGEQQTIALLSMALNDLGCKAISLTGLQAKIRTKGSHTRASILNIKRDIIKKFLNEGNVVVIAGFQGVNEEGDITTLGRGGSDTTAVALAAEFNCPCEIYTDVDGIYSIDPKIYKNSQRISRLNYDIALEMSRLGARIIDKRALTLGKKFKVPLYIGNSFNNKIGTIIGGGNMEELKVLSLVADCNQIQVKIKNIPNDMGKLSHVFKILGKYNLDIGMTENNLVDGNLEISFVCSKEYIKLLSSIEKEMISTIYGFIEMEISESTRVSIIGNGRINQAEITSNVFDIIDGTNIKYKKLYTSELSLSYFFDGGDINYLINRLAEVFNL